MCIILDTFLQREYDLRTSTYVVGDSMLANLPVAVLGSYIRRDVLLEAAAAAVVLAARKTRACAVAAAKLARAVNRPAPCSGAECGAVSASDAELLHACMQLVLNSTAASQPV